jgi:crossover junction endodeoxyribonuclease RuvC
MSATPTTILAVDPGLTGALAWMQKDPDGAIRLLAVADMPTATAQVGKSLKAHVQPALLADLMQNPAMPGPEALVIEKVNAMPGQGVTSMFRFGFVAGMIEGVGAALRLPIHHLRSNEWQPIAQVKRGDDAGRLRALQLFPEHSQTFARKKDHNRADAVLIGYAFLKKQA